MRTRTCRYQGVRNVIFLENFANVINKWSLTGNLLKYFSLLEPMKLFFRVPLDNYFCRFFITHQKSYLLQRRIYKPEYIFFKSPDRLSGRNNVTSNKGNFWPDIRQNCHKKIRISKVYMARYKAIWSYCNVINIKLW